MLRLVVLALSLAAAGYTWRDSRLAYLRNQVLLNSGQASAGSDLPGDPYADLVSAQAELADGTRRIADPAGAERAARAVLARSPLNPGALFVLGSISEARQPGSGERWFMLTESVSRREFQNELTLERLSAMRGDRAGVVARVDRIASVAPSVAPTVLASMAPALQDEELRGLFLKRAARPWFPELAKAAITQGVATPIIDQLITAAEPNFTASTIQGLRSSHLGYVLLRRDYQQARELVARLPLGARRMAATFGFSASSLQLGDLGWDLAGGEALNATVDGEGSLAINAGVDQAGIVASRTTLLDPGTYSLEWSLNYDESAPKASLTLDASCLSLGGAEIWRADLAVPPGATSARATVTLPAGCTGQLWRLHVVGEAAQAPSRANLRLLGLVRQ